MSSRVEGQNVRSMDPNDMTSMGPIGLKCIYRHTKRDLYIFVIIQFKQLDREFH